MRVIFAMCLLIPLAEGCARKPPDTPQPQPAPAASAPPPSAPVQPKPASPPSTKGKPAPPSAKAPAAQPTTAPKSASPATPKAASLDLVALKEQLKATKAIGIMTKISLKNQVDDLLDRFRDHYAGKGSITMLQLRQSYDLLMMKVLSLLQDKDQKLASDIVASREAIWGLLADPNKFAALDV
jgi:hypothetical protein